MYSTEITPDRQTFHQLAKQGNVIPITREVLADMETPVSVFRRFVDRPNAFLLESVAGGERLARYSFLGADPKCSFRARGNTILFTENDSVTETELQAGEEPMQVIQKILGDVRFVDRPGLPRFVGGALGYIGWDWIKHLEPIPATAADDTGVDDIHMFLVDTMVIFDHVKHRLIFLTNAHCPVGADLDQVYDDACAALNQLETDALAPRPDGPTRHAQKAHCPPPDGHWDMNLTRDDYDRMISTAKEYITAGDIIQVVLAQRFTRPLNADPFDIYRTLRAINPSPYMYYLQFDTGTTLVGASPEVLVTEDEGRVTIRPIAGTRPRGVSRAEDDQLAAELLADEKERAEHIMLVDLARNDIGRVCKYGSVRVDELMVIERYSHVMHIVSNVVGELAPDRNAFDLLRATFPAGTLSGAPKVRAMQIIDELEPCRRGTYGGAIGYLSYKGSFDACITLRTALIRDGLVHVQAGGGIVADSVADTEYIETVNKSGAIRRAVELAEKGLDKRK
ncbi:MAG: anthranilate synthase component I [Armatimonadaceae bacterium]